MGSLFTWMRRFWQPRTSSIWAQTSKDGNGSDTLGIESRYHLLPHFNSNTNMDSSIFKYEYKTDVLDSDFYSDIYSSQLKNVYCQI